MVLHDATKRKLTYGSLAEAAAKLPVPADVPLKDPKQFHVIGKSTKRLDTPDKVNGRAEFGIDIRRPGMLYAVVVRCPVFGGKVASFDATKAKAVPGVKNVIQISSGVAVVADSTWTAMQGRRALDVKWDEGANASVSSESISKLFAERAAQPGVEARKEGDAAAALAGAAKKIEAVYEAPFLAHATMEPQNCTADVRADRCDVWAPTQFQTMAQGTAAKICGLKPEAVFIHTTFLGGGFGRKAGTDFVIEAVETSKAIGAPVKVTWSREDDTQHDYYRPASYARMAGALDADGWPVAWTTRVACPSIMNLWFPGSIKNNLDPTSVEGVENLPYSIPNILVDYQLTDTGVPVGFWRSVGNSQNGFFSESFMDELAAAGKKDPYEFRRHHAGQGPAPSGRSGTCRAESGMGQAAARGTVPRNRGAVCISKLRRPGRGNLGEPQRTDAEGSPRRLRRGRRARRESNKHRGAERKRRGVRTDGGSTRRDHDFPRPRRADQLQQLPHACA